MKLAYSSNAYMKTSISNAIRRIASLGYRGIELMADVPHLWPKEVSQGTIAEVRAQLADHGLTISNINAFMMNAVGDFWHPSWIEPDADYRQQRVKHTIDALKMASALGAKCITTEPGGPLGTKNLSENLKTCRPARVPPRAGTPPIARGSSCFESETKEGNVEREAALALFVRELQEPLRVAEGEGVLLLTEPEPGLLIENVDQFLELAGQIHSPVMGLNFDIGHFFCVGEELPEAVARLQNYTRHYHMEDIAANRIHEHLIPGHGAIDWASVFAAIRETSYDGWITVELYPYLDDPDGAGRCALEFLTPFLPPSYSDD